MELTLIFGTILVTAHEKKRKDWSCYANVTRKVNLLKGKLQPGQEIFFVVNFPSDGAVIFFLWIGAIRKVTAAVPVSRP